MSKKPEPADAARHMTKTAAVMASVAAGVDVPALGVGYVKQHYGIDVTPQQFSIIKSQAKKKAGELSLSRRDNTSVVSRNGGPADLARQVKQLVDSYGVDAVKGMADVFSD